MEQMLALHLEYSLLTLSKTTEVATTEVYGQMLEIMQSAIDLQESSDQNATTLRNKLFIYVGSHGILSLLATLLPSNFTTDPTLLRNVSLSLPFASLLRFDLLKTYMPTPNAVNKEDFDYAYTIRVKWNDMELKIC